MRQFARIATHAALRAVFVCGTSLCGVLFCSALFCAASELFAQTPAAPNGDTITESILTILTPSEFRNARHLRDLREFVRRDLPALASELAVELAADSTLKKDKLKQNKDVSGIEPNVRRDVVLADALYLKALSLSQGSLAPMRDALLLCTMACLTHKHIPLKIGLNIPLTTEDDSSFRARIYALPKRIFADSPHADTSSRNATCDADKLQHFFGSAFAALGLDNAVWADWLGLLVEGGESKLVVGEQFDERDVRANRLGQAFARLLERKPNALPSSVLLWWNVTGQIPTVK